MKRSAVWRLALAVLAVFALFAFSACGSGSSSSDDEGAADTETTDDTAADDSAADDTAADDTAADDSADDEGEMADEESTDDAAAEGGDEAAAGSGDGVGVSLILKNTSNPFFISMANSAQAEADTLGVNLTVAAGQDDGDTDTQIQAIEAAVAKGDKGILITPSGDAVLPALKSAKEAGVYVIALDTPPSDPTAVDITFATDNYLAGQLIGEWAAGTINGEKATIAMLDLFDDQVVSVDIERDQGFLKGMGIMTELDESGNGNEPATGSYSGGEYEVVCHEPTNGAADGGRTAMENCLAANPDINVVYTINEPAAQGAYDALTAAGKADGVTIVSVDGGCDPGLRLISEGVIGGTAQQYPGKMATLGMEAIVELANTGQAPTPTDGLDFFNTGVALVTDAPVDGVDSISVAEGQEVCWG